MVPLVSLSCLCLAGTDIRKSRTLVYWGCEGYLLSPKEASVIEHFLSALPVIHYYKRQLWLVITSLSRSHSSSELYIFCPKGDWMLGSRPYAVMVFPSDKILLSFRDFINTVCESPVF